MCQLSQGYGVSGLFSSIFFLHILKQKKRFGALTLSILCPVFFLGKRDWARSHNQVVIVHCLVELFLHPSKIILEASKGEN